jgi:uncharacterized membrane protein YfcA
MTWKRAVIVFLAMVITSFIGFVILEALDAEIYIRGATVFFLMATVGWLVARDYIKENLLLGRSFATWFFGTLTIAVIITLLMWRFWPR